MVEAFQMRLSEIFRWSRAGLLCFLVASLMAVEIPRMTAVDPDEAKPGDVVTVSGENLEKANVQEVYLTDGKNDIKVEVLEQSSNTIKIKIPEKINPGRYALMILTGGDQPAYIEQPVKVNIQAPGS